MGELYRHESSGDGTATVELDPDTRSGTPVEPDLYAKFTEHLAWNVSHGIDAQVAYNPTFGRWRFREVDPTADGGFVGSVDPERREAMIEEHAEQHDLPGTEGLAEAAEDGLSFWWQRRGERDEVAVSPDVGQHGERGQRVEIEETSADDPRGIVQWLYLPLQRTRGYEYEVTVRARADTEVDLRLAFQRVDDEGDPEAELVGTDLEVADEWTAFEGELELPADAAAGDDDLLALTLTSTESCDVVLDRALVYPDDHVDRPTRTSSSSSATPTCR